MLGQLQALLEAADLQVRRSTSRDYHGTIDDDRIDRVSVLRPQEIPIYVQDGLFDLGITGNDWVTETDADVARFNLARRDDLSARYVTLLSDDAVTPTDHAIALYERAGAKYFFALANHHDNFDAYASNHNAWNSVNVGP